MSSIEEGNSLLDALSQVDKLDELNVTISECPSAGVMDQDQPSIEALPCSILYQANFDSNFEDRNGFITGIAKYIEEATIHAALNELLVEGEKHAITLYTWRCCSRGIPQPKCDEDPNRVEIYEKTIEVLTPEVDKLFALMKFQKLAIERFCGEVKVLCHPEKRKQFVSEAYLLTLGKFINMFCHLDELKNIKSSVKNDFSTYKRAAQFLKLMSDMQTLQESQNLSLFLATQNKIRNNLKKNLEKIKDYEEILCDVINISVQMFEGRMYLLPSEKHMLVKVIGFCLDLIDNDRCNIYKLDHRKKLRLEKVDKIFKGVQVVPLYGDMQISPFQYVKRSKNFDQSKWPLCSASSSSGGFGTVALPPQIDVVRMLPQISQEHLKFICELQECSQMNCTMANGGTNDDTGSVTSSKDASSGKEEKESEKVVKLAMKGLRLLSGWTGAVSEMYSWKLLNPTDHHQNPQCPPDAEEYERATRYNYSNEEKSALVEVISLIKSLQLTLSKMETLFSDHIRKHIYSKLQNFVQLTLREPLRKAAKNKKEVLRTVLMSIRHTSGDFSKCSKEAEQDPILKGEKAPSKYVEHYQIGGKPVGPSSTQLYLLRTMLESLISDKTCANRHLRKDMESSSIPSIDSFFKRTFFWGHLQNYGEVLWKCADLSQLWYREFYLEMTMGKRIQFPIEMSMPWILIKYVLENPSMMEYALYPLDLYNDSCHCALNTFSKQFLYDELEAEVNLCFDQFVYKLSEQIFSYHKRLAATTMLDKRFQMEAKFRQGSDLTPPPVYYRYESLMRQRRVQLLGHSVDLCKLIQQRISRDLLKSLEVAIRLFQEGDLTGIVQLEGLISLNRETHKLLRVYLTGLDSFEMLWKEANFNVTSAHGRTTIHVFCEVNWDFLPNYCYNGVTNRFVRAQGVTFSKRATEHREVPLPTGTVLPLHLWGSKQLNSAYMTLFGRYSGFLGEPHFRAMVRLLGYRGIAVVMQELLKVTESIVKGPLYEFTKALMVCMPKNCKGPLKPLNNEGSPGMLAFYLDVLHDILQYPDVKMKLFQNFREVGNAILFCLQMEKTLSQEENWMLVHAAPLQSIFPKPFRRGSEDEEDLQKRVKSLEKELATMNVAKTVEVFGTAPQRTLTKEVDLLAKERLCCGLSIFREILEKIKIILQGNTEWMGSPPENQVMNLEQGTEFYRIWSALQFGFCIPAGVNELSVEQLYGDGLMWAGCTIIFLLDQQRRFELMDFCNRLQEAQRRDGKNGVFKGISLEQMALRIRCHQQLNTQIFAILRRYMEPEIPLKTTIEKVRCFPAPIHKLLLSDMMKTQAQTQNQLEESKTKVDTDSGGYAVILPRVGTSTDCESISGTAECEGSTSTTTRVSVLYQNQKDKDDHDHEVGSTTEGGYSESSIGIGGGGRNRASSGFGEGDHGMML